MVGLVLRGTGGALACAVTTACSFGMSAPAAYPVATRPPDCETGRTAPVFDTLGMVGVVAAELAFLAVIGQGEGDLDSEITAGLTLGLVAIGVYGTAAVIGFRASSRCRTATDAWIAAGSPDDRPRQVEVIPDEAPLVETIQATDPLARQLTIQARRAALRGQCSITVAMGGRVKQLDRPYHAKVFVVDPPIAKCLAR